MISEAALKRSKAAKSMSHALPGRDHKILNVIGKKMYQNPMLTLKIHVHQLQMLNYYRSLMEQATLPDLPPETLE